MSKIEMLAKFLECEVDDLKESYSENRFEYGNQEYLVVNEDEREEEVKEYIRESLWAFNANFILNNSKISDQAGNKVEKALKKMQEELCEDANELVFALLTDFDDFVEEAVSADGYGHFLSQYDGEENEVQDKEGNWYYIYRTN